MEFNNSSDVMERVDRLAQVMRETFFIHHVRNEFAALPFKDLAEQYRAVWRAMAWAVLVDLGGEEETA